MGLEGEEHDGKNARRDGSRTGEVDESLRSSGVLRDISIGVTSNEDVDVVDWNKVAISRPFRNVKVPFPSPTKRSF